MIISVDNIKAHIDCGELSDNIILTRLNAIEQVIRAFTHNNFQNRNARFEAEASGGVLSGASPFIRVGDTVQISQSLANDGLYTVIDVTDGQTTIDGDLFATKKNLVTKIQYPDDVVQCAIDLFKWKIEFGDKIGIKSESEALSRHSESVTYEDSATLFMGYPVGILKGLALHSKARF
jgi:hypothetical protein